MSGGLGAAILRLLWTWICPVRPCRRHSKRCAMTQRRLLLTGLLLAVIALALVVA